MNNITPWRYQDTDLRVVTIDGEPWWVAKDVCDVLDFTNRGNVAARLDNDDIRLMDIVDSAGKKQEATIINETGLYRIIMRLDKPEAIAFQRWISKEVLPQI